MVWYAGNGNGHIGRLDPKTGKITRYAMPDPEARDPHTLVLDQKGDIWFTVQNSNFVGRLATKTGKVDLIKVATFNARPYGIKVDSKGRPWFNEFGSDKLAMIDPASLKIREYTLPNNKARGRRMAITSDDRVWLVETGTQPNRLVGFDPRTEKFFGITPIPSGGGTVRHMMFDARAGQIWFGTDNNTIWRAEGTWMSLSSHWHPQQLSPARRPHGQPGFALASCPPVGRAGLHRQRAGPHGFEVPQQRLHPN